MAKVELVHVGACKKSLIVEVPADTAQKEFDRVSREFARHAKVDGFRPGKTPLSIIKRRYQAEIRKQLTQEVLPRFFNEALEAEEIKPISEPTLDNFDYQEGGLFKFRASFEILPSIHLEGYQDLRVSSTPREITPEDIEKGLEAIQEKYTKYIPIEDRPAKLGDFVTVNLTGKILDGSDIEFTDKDVIIELGGADTVKGFTEHLSGVQAEDKRSFSIQYPAEFHNPRLAGMEIAYQAEVIAIKEKLLPALNDDLAIEAGEFANIEELRESVGAGLREEAKREHEANVADELLEQVIATNTVEVPECLVDGELQELVQKIAGQMVRQGIEVSRATIDWKRVAEENRPKALERARKKIVLNAIADQESLTITDNELEAEVKRLAGLVQKTPEAFRAGLVKEDRLEELKAQMRLQKALEWIRKSSTGG